MCMYVTVYARARVCVCVLHVCVHACVRVCVDRESRIVIKDRESAINPRGSMIGFQY